MDKLTSVRRDFPDSPCYAMTDEGLKPIEPPKYSDWKIELVKGTHWHVLEGGEKNWFHRKMQELFFGIKWTKVKRNG